MGFRDQFRPAQSLRSRLLGLIGAARGMAGNDPRAALRRLEQSGATCTLPDGRVIEVGELVRMAEGKTPQQLLEELGLQ